jgi:radical SAM superfamily enzyme YgiQ (UPF0313 family)
MTHYDVLFLHPPRVFKGFWRKLREKPEQKMRPQFCFVPMGLFSLAADLDERGYAVKIVNLGIEQDLNRFFNLKRYIQSVQAKIFAIDLQWVLSSSGAIALARVCKQYHPDSLVVLGGMTATWFHEEILKTHPFIDVVLRGEADYSLPQLVEAVSQSQGLKGVAGISYRQGEHIQQTHTGRILQTLDSIDPTRLELLVNYEKYVYAGVYQCGRPASKDDVSAESALWYPVLRGCPYNCAHCGGGQHAYRVLTGRDEIALRSPEKVANDLQILAEKGVQRIKFSHDLEVGGEKYYLTLLQEVRERNLDIGAYVEVFRLPTRKFASEVTRTFHDAAFALSPESPDEEVRRLIGRDFSNHDLFKTLDVLKTEGIATRVFFTVGLPGEVPHPDPGWERWLTRFKKFIEDVMAHGGLPLPPTVYTIDPNCLMAVNRKKYGINLLLKTFADYERASASESDLDWIGHETKTLSQVDIGVLTGVSALTVHSDLMRMNVQNA